MLQRKRARATAQRWWGGKAKYGLTAATEVVLVVGAEHPVLGSGAHQAQHWHLGPVRDVLLLVCRRHFGLGLQKQKQEKETEIIIAQKSRRIEQGII